MPLIEWKDEFEIGIPSVDYEHRGMILMINKLHGKLAENGGKDMISDFLGEIHSLVSAHFALEEKEMIEMAYDAFEEHKDDHEDLLDQIRDMMDELERDDSGDIMKDLSRRLNHWFTEHFRTRDARLHNFLTSI
ncbi:MAG: hemerythrin family protein, partial [Alphaproteobacteria bacterium]|nr:hemerythrin family protein [Alphaproteobacteria bacterium]